MFARPGVGGPHRARQRGCYAPAVLGIRASSRWLHSGLLRHGALPLAVALGVASACSESTAPLDGYNLVLVNIDTLRADHLGCYGYERNTSPFLDSLCRDGVVFESALANSSYTRESVAALFSGRLPSASGSTGWHAAPVPGVATLAERLRAAGYATALFSNTVMLRRPGFERGFDTVRHLSSDWNSSGEESRLSERVLAHLAEHPTEAPFFFYIHYLDPHAPYQPSPEARSGIGAAPRDTPLSLYDDVAPDLAALRARGFGPGHPDFEDLVARYDAEIRTTDAALRRLVEGLDALGLLERSLLVVTADHGEEFLEHDYIDHGWTLYDEVIRVPLVFHAPALLAPDRARVGAAHVDVVPTVLELLGVEPGLAQHDGRPLFEPGPQGRPLPVDEDAPRISELLIEERQILRAVIEDRWKYIATYREVPPNRRAAPGKAPGAMDAWLPVMREELYDLERDPAERHDLLLDADAGEAEEVRERLAGRLEELRARTRGRAAAKPQTLPRDVPAEDRAHLEALGYLAPEASD